MTKKSCRIIIDTNLWISFLISKNHSKLDSIIFTKQCTLVFSEELINEFITVVNRPKFKAYISSSDITEILETVEAYAGVVNVKSKVEACSDSKDNFLLALSKDGNVDFHLTGDNDLLFGIQKKPTLSQAHLVLPTRKANAEKPKELAFSIRSLNEMIIYLLI